MIALPARRRRPLSLMTLRILAVHILALLVVMGGLLFLGFYEDELIENELQGLRNETRVFASLLGEAAVTYGMGDGPELVLSDVLAEPLVTRLVETNETRAVLFGAQGGVIVDSRVVGQAQGMIEMVPLPPLDGGSAAPQPSLSSVLEQILPKRTELQMYPLEGDKPVGDFPDVALSLDGDLTARAWQTSDGGIIITATAPVQRFREVMGAVFLARDGTQIEKALSTVRTNILQVMAVSLAISVLMSIYLARAIDRPIRRLALAAEDVRRSKNRRVEIPDFTDRGDEIGDLSGALRDMTEALWSRLDAIERFAADVSHELKNPLTSMRSAIETVSLVRDPERQQHLMAIIQEDVVRLDRLISDISAFSRLDSELSKSENQRVHIGQMLQMLADIHQTTLESRGIAEVPITLIGADRPDLVALGVESRLTQVFQNLIGNAVSFSPPGSHLTIKVWREDGEVITTVADQGPGIPESKLEAIFDRFYSERPHGEKFGQHSGLGLSISKQIVENVGGRIYATNLRDKNGEVVGAMFTVRLPRA